MLQLKCCQLRGSVECEIIIPISHLPYPIISIECSKFRISENTWSNVYILFKFRNKIWIDHLLSELSKHYNILTSSLLLLGSFVRTLSSQKGVWGCARLYIFAKGIGFEFLHLLLNSTWKGFNLLNESFTSYLLLQSEHIYLDDH